MNSNAKRIKDLAINLVGIADRLSGSDDLVAVRQQILVRRINEAVQQGQTVVATRAELTRYTRLANDYVCAGGDETLDSAIAVLVDMGRG